MALVHRCMSNSINVYLYTYILLGPFRFSWTGPILWAIQGMAWDKDKSFKSILTSNKLAHLEIQLTWQPWNQRQDKLWSSNILFWNILLAPDSYRMNPVRICPLMHWIKLILWLKWHKLLELFLYSLSQIFKIKTQSKRLNHFGKMNKY